jgi:hypothetical protein
VTTTTVGRLYRLHRPLMIATAGMVGLALVSLVGLLVDDRTLVGAPIWGKPLKFAVSLAIYLPTMAWLTALLDSRVARWAGTAIAVGGGLEMVAIVGQVLRGRQSHFNVATALDAQLYSLMGTTIATVWVCTAIVGVQLLIARPDLDRATVTAVRLGLPISLAGMGVGFLMTMPTAAQNAALRDGPPTVVGAHSVGVADGGPGLPLVGWSTTGGDLRIGHFVGLHALQALPLLALALVHLGRRVPVLADPATRRRILVVAAVGYAGLLGLLTWQALRGQSIVHPDALTGGAALMVLLATAAGGTLVLARPPRVVAIGSGV